MVSASARHASSEGNIEMVTGTIWKDIDDVILMFPIVVLRPSAGQAATSENNENMGLMRLIHISQ